MASVCQRLTRPGMARTPPCLISYPTPVAHVVSCRRIWAPRAQGGGTGSSHPGTQNAPFPTSEDSRQFGVYRINSYEQAQRGLPAPVVLPQQAAQPLQSPYLRPTSVDQTLRPVQDMHGSQPIQQTRAAAAIQHAYELQPHAPSTYTGQDYHPVATHGAAEISLPRVNPGKTYMNSVMLLGMVGLPERQASSVRASLYVPFSTKAGHEEFVVEAWKEVGNELELCGSQKCTVIVEGRLAKDSQFGVKVVAYRIKLVDPTLPPTGASAVPRTSKVATRARLEPAAIWRAHYETQTQAIQSLATHFNCSPASVEKALMQYAFQTQSPLRWRALSEEAGLSISGGCDEDLTLHDFMAVVSRYRNEMDDMRAAAPPGAAAPEMPITKEGMLKVRPIRDWALSKGDQNAYCYAIKSYEAKHDLGKLYSLLRLAVVAEATQGAWDYEAEFGP